GGGGGDVDDAAQAVTAEDLDGLAGDEEGAVDVDVEHPLPLLGADLSEGGRGGDAGVVDHAHQLGQLGVDAGHGRGDRVLVGDVHAEPQGGGAVLAGDLGGDLLGGGLVQVQHRHRPTVTGQTVGGRAADPALGGATGDDRGGGV